MEKAQTKHAYHAVPVGKNDLMLKVNLTLETQDGVAVAEVNNAVKVDSVAGNRVSFDTIRKVEKHLDLVVVAPFISAVGDYVHQSMEARLRPGTPLEGGGPNATHPNAQDEVEAAKDRLEPCAPWQKGPGSSQGVNTVGPAEPKTGFFERSAV